VSCLQAYYPETLGLCCVHKAPWVFSTSKLLFFYVDQSLLLTFKHLVWSMITPLLDPVVSSKIVFTKSVPDLQKYIDPECLPIIITGDQTKPSKDERTVCPPLKAGHIANDAELEDYWEAIKNYEIITHQWIQDGDEDALERLQLGQKYRIARIKAEKVLRGETVYHGKGLVNIDDKNRLILDYGTTSWTPQDITEWV
jgi:hypothetical protein